MGIRRVHRHGQKECFSTRSTHALDNPGIFEFIHPDTSVVIRVGGAYMGFTGGFYLYDLDTGDEIVHFGLKAGREFFDQVIEPHRVGTLAPDPDCMVIQ